MNCRPGDLAYFFTRGPLRDKIIRVTELDQNPDCDEPMWLYEGPRILMGAFGEYVSFRDSALRPIRDPGEDATDEMIWLVGSPAWDRAWREV